MIKAEPIISNRIRNIRNCTFGWLDHNLLHFGFIQRLEPESLLLYFFLCLVADRNGCSFYDYDKICSLLKIDVQQYLQARQQLIDQSLIEFKSPIFQVLSLPKTGTEKMIFCHARNRKTEHISESTMKSMKDILTAGINNPDKMLQ